MEDKTKLDMGEVSDGYHTFNELYEYRLLYNAAFFNELAKQNLYDVHKSKKHSDGEDCFGGGWFKNLLERFNDKRIFVFTHKFFIHKAGNNNSGSGMNYSEDDWRVSRFDQNHSSYCLCGLQFEFLNKLNNTYKNTIWFTAQ